jgi:tRNA(Ile)-lysidine synthase TilS/MesJ
VNWTPALRTDTVAQLKEKLVSKVVMALSGGVDSTVAATLINRYRRSFAEFLLTVVYYGG